MDPDFPQMSPQMSPRMSTDRRGKEVVTSVSFGRHATAVEWLCWVRQPVGNLEYESSNFEVE